MCDNVIEVVWFVDLLVVCCGDVEWGVVLVVVVMLVDLFGSIIDIDYFLCLGDVFWFIDVDVLLVECVYVVWGVFVCGLLNYLLVSSLVELVGDLVGVW